MKDKKRVAELISALKTEIEFPHELLLIEQLEIGLNSKKPNVEIIDENTQNFNGLVYKRTASGHYKCLQSKSLHVAVYEYFCEKIPKGCCIHHRDLNPANNNLENLELLTKSDHRKLHNQLETKEVVCANCGRKIYRRVSSKESVHFCNTYCKVRWYYKNGLYFKEKICPVCGKKFKTSDKNAIFCSHKCDMQDRNGNISRKK